VDHPVKVWLGGEGPCEIGDRDRPGGQRVGALEALLRRVEADGWTVAGAVRWQHIRKFRVGAAIGRENHGDIHSIAGLLNMAYEAGCEIVAFARDVDADSARPNAIARGLELASRIAHLGQLGVIGGPAIPALEGWILALLGVRDTDRMSRDRANQLLSERGLAGKHAEDYVAVIESANLEPLCPGCAALGDWLRRARVVLGQAIRGATR
jgi:hypothetical protein